MHYFSRWDAHAKSRAAEGGLRAAAARRADAAAGAPGEDESWLPRALEVLLAARRRLGASYVFAFYAFGGEMFAGDDAARAPSWGVAQALFENQQQLLEAEVERLSGLCERPPGDAPGGPAGLRRAAIDSAANVDRRLVGLGGGGGLGEGRGDLGFGGHGASWTGASHARKERAAHSASPDPNNPTLGDVVRRTCTTPSPMTCWAP